MKPGETEAQMLQRNLERMQKAKEEKDLERKKQELEKKKTELEHKREVRRSARFQAGAIVRKEPAPAAAASAASAVASTEKITHLTKDRPMVKGAGGKSRRPPTRGHHKKVT
jgi:hypothetical protein